VSFLLSILKTNHINIFYGQTEVVWRQLSTGKVEVQTFKEILFLHRDCLRDKCDLCCCFGDCFMKKFTVNPVSIFVWIWLVVMNGVFVATSYFLAILIHELGHFFTAKRLGYKVTRFSFSPYGVELSYFDQNINYRDELLIALAGPFSNLITVIFVVGFWWIFPAVYFFTESFVMISMLIAVFNLLPAYPLDGGRAFVSLMSNFVSAKLAKRITMFLNVLFAVLFFVIFVACLFVNFNPSLILFSFFLFAGLIDLKFISKYEKINVFTKETKNFSKPTMLCVNDEVCLKELLGHLQTSKTIVFCVLLKNGKIINVSENLLKKLAMEFSYETKLKDIFYK